MERCANSEALKKHMEKLQELEQDQEFFDDDTELLFNEIEGNIMRIKEIATGYDAYFDEYIEDRIKEML